MVLFRAAILNREMMMVNDKWTCNSEEIGSDQQELASEGCTFHTYRLFDVQSILQMKQH